MKEKLLIIVRHAHREILDRIADNGLSARGQIQANKIAEYFRVNFAAKKFKLYSSPRLRCKETLAPLSLELSEPVEISPLLDEGASGGRPEVERRVHEFKVWWERNAPDLIVICSHGDWIPYCLQALMGEYLEIRKGGLAEIQLKGSGARLKKILPPEELDLL